MNENPAKYFDEILAFLSTDYNRIFSFSDVLNHLYRDKRKGQSHAEKFLMFPLNLMRILTF